MRLLAIDPASIRTGYAYLRDGKVHDAGYLSGAKGDEEPIDRILTMCGELRTLVGEILPDLVVIEVTSGHVGRKRHKGGGAGLPTYGMAVGGIYVYATVLAEEYMHDVWPVKENVWTHGIPKEHRQGEVALYEPRYSEAYARDPGGDVADAIGIGWWALGELARRKAVAAS